MKEVWKDITGYEGLYQISNLGKVKSLNYKRTGKEKILKTSKNNNGYLSVLLYKNKESKKFLLHRLVANAFIKNPNNYPYINHKDENKENNIINNLEWCTHQYNICYGTRIERFIKSNSIPIYCLETNKIYKSAKECAKELNLNRPHIVDVLKGRLKHTKGYTFRYANQVL